jgi:ribosome-associated protein
MCERPPEAPSEDRVPESPTPAPDATIARSRELAVAIADAISETPASDTRVIDIHDLSTIADFFVICSGENERQLRAISRSLVEDFGETERRPRTIEGEPVSGWILMDYEDVIVHIFDRDLRAFYDLEERWSEAPVLLSIQ